MNTTFRKIGAVVMGITLITTLTTSCSNSDWETSSIPGGIEQGGNNGKVSVYFSMQAPIRTITLGNDDDAVNTDDNAHQFKLMATIGGIYKNTKDRKISYAIDPSLLDESTGMEVLPSSYYTIEDGSLTIPAGSIVGGATVKLTDAFFNDPKAATTHYVLPVRLVSTNDCDTILESKNYQLLCVKYKNRYTGLYCKTGTSDVQTLKTITHKNEDALDVVSTYDMNTSSVKFSYPVKELRYNSKNNSWDEADATHDIALTLKFSGESCQVLQGDKVVGTGSFTPRGIQDFSDKNRMADCLKLKFTVTTVTNAGDADHEKIWTINADYVMSMMSRNNKLESWK